MQPKKKEIKKIDKWQKNIGSKVRAHWGQKQCYGNW